MKNEGELTPLPLKTMAERTQNIQRVSLEFLSERMKNEELRETDAHSFHDNGGENRDIQVNFCRISLGENEG